MSGKLWIGVSREAEQELAREGRLKSRLLASAIKKALAEPAAASRVFDIVGPLKGLPVGEVVVVYRRVEPHETPTGEPGLMIVRVLAPDELESLASPPVPAPPSVGEALGDLAEAVLRAILKR